MIMIHIHEEAARCLLCEDAPCTKACKTGDVARAIRAIRFDNEGNAQRFVADCADADLARAEEACVHYDRPIRIREMLASVCRDAVKTDHVKPSLAISFCGIPCENPFFLASSAVCTNYDMVARAFDAGWAGVFYKTICKQDIREVSPRFDAVKSDTRFAGFRNMEQLSENPYVMDFDILRRLKQDYPTKVVVASVMGQFEEEWAELAQMAEAAGCDAVELNFSCPQMRLAGMGSDVGQNPELVTFYTAYVKRAVHIPVIVKMTPNITRITEPAIKKVELSGIGGIETWRDALEYIQLGCRNVQVCTAVMEYGYRIIDDLTLGLQTYMLEHGIERLDDLVGSEMKNFVLPSDLDRDTIVYPKVDRARCIGCGRCHRSCMDGGHQAIAFDTDTRRPRIVGTKCVGCHLCRLVCPTGAIGLTKRINKKQ